MFTVIPQWPYISYFVVYILKYGVFVEHYARQQQSPKKLL